MKNSLLIKLKTKKLNMKNNYCCWQCRGASVILECLKFVIDTGTRKIMEYNC